MNYMIDISEKACIIYENYAKGPKTSCNAVGPYYTAFDKDTNKLIGADVSKNELMNMLHQKYGYHMFDIREEY